MTDFYPSDFENDKNRNKGDPMHYGRSKKKETYRYLAYLDAIHKVKPKPLPHYSTMTTMNTSNIEDEFKKIRKIVSQSQIDSSKGFRVYVIELDNPYIVYVGQSWHHPKERLRRHRKGIRSSRHVRKAKNPKLRPDLYKGYPVFKTRQAAEAAEKELAKKLLRLGYIVKGGH